ncbi:MAG: DnaB-like helicase C-terminal domain-containing protein [Myxococcota bacterium]
MTKLQRPQLERELAAYVTAYDGAAEEANVRPELFAQPTLRAIVAAAQAVADEGGLVDDARQILAAAHRLGLKLRAEALTDLKRTPLEGVDPVFHAAHLEALNREGALKRHIRELVELADGHRFDEVNALLARMLERNIGDGARAFEYFSWKDAVGELLETMVQGDSSCARHVALGVLDPLAAHLLPGMFAVFGGDTGTGKSTLALWLMERWAEAGGQPAVVSLEDRASIWANRWLGSRIFRSFMSRSEMREAFAAYSEFEAEVDWDAQRGGVQQLNDNSVATILDGMRDVVRRGADLVVVDYLQEAAEPEQTPSRARFLANVARDAKAAGKRLGVPVVMLSQLSRPEGKKRRVPTRWDLKGTGDLENMSEAIVLLWKPDKSGPTLGVVDKYKNDVAGDMFRIERGGAGTVRRLARVQPGELEQDSEEAVSQARRDRAGGGW